MLERNFEEKFLKKLKSLDGVYVPPKVDAPSSRGLPDRIICVKGRYVALEFKRTEREIVSKRAKLQAYTLDEIIKAGGIGRFVTPANADYIFKMIERLVNES
jgi:hypothetical protein